MINIKNMVKRVFLFRKRILFRILIYFMIPIFISFLSILALYYYYNDFFRRDAEMNYYGALQNISKSVNSTFSEIYLTVNMLPINSNLISLIRNDKPLELNEYAILTDCSTTLRLLRSTKDCIDKAFLIDKEDQIVLSSDGSSSIDLFFSSFSRFSDYPEFFWLNSELVNFRFLKPTTVTNTINGQTKSVIPIIQNRIGNFTSRKTFVITLKKDYFDDILKNQRFTENSMLFISDEDGTIISNSNMMDTDFVSWYHSLINHYFEDEKKTTLTTEYQGTRMLVIFHKTGVLSNTFIYSACIPLTDLYSKTNYIKDSLFIVTTIMIILSIIISSIMAAHLFNPIRRLIEIIRSRSEDNSTNTQTDDFVYLGSSINNIITSSDHMKNELSKAMPIVSEQLLLKILNKDEFLRTDNLNLVLANLGIEFVHPFFCVAQLNLLFTNDFKKHFDKTEQQRILEKVMKLLMDMLPSECQAKIIHFEKGRTVIIMNIPESYNIAGISMQFQSFLDLFSYDTIYMQAYIGIGRAYAGMEGMVKSYEEAGLSISYLSKSNLERIRIYASQSTQNCCDLSYSEQNKLFNYILSGNKIKLNELLSNLLNDTEKSISEQDLIQVMIQVYQIGCNVAKYKGVTPDTLLSKAEMEILSNCCPAKIEDAKNALDAFILNVLSLCDKNSYKANAQIIRDYIDCHYSEDLYADKIAEKFSVSTTHLSRLLKEALSMSFQQYLSFVRITHAKEDLMRTNKSIQNIALSVGFNSRNTFIRMFEKLEGISPSEYRKNMSH